jgi:ribosomal protein S18 acetylase RimI-like enzyme
MTTLVAFRSICEEDSEFLYSVYASTREEELAVVDWTAEQKEQFLRMQFTAQHKHYQENYANARFEVILLDGKPSGRLYVDRRDDEIRIVDIALLSEHRGRGIGGQILTDILAEGEKTGKAVRIHVEQNNPALHLYQRLGFRQIGETGVYLLLEWVPETACNAAGPSEH